MSSLANKPPVFRLALPSDADAIVDLVTSGYRGEPSKAGWTTEADLLDGPRTDAEEVRSLIADPESAILLAETDGKLIGCCNIAQKDGSGYFGLFAVEPTLQAGGIGRAMLAEAERRLVEDFGCRDCHMQVIEMRHELIAWYERRGYARTGKFKEFPYGDERAGFPRRPDLRFTILTKQLD